MAKPALGRGLGALLSASNLVKPAPAEPRPAAGARNADPIASHAPGSPGEAVRRVALEHVVPCPLQPRKTFEPEALKELADSIHAQGIVQPLVVRERNGKFELIAGERRLRAASMAGLKEVPIIVREADDRAVLELALIENLQRENLNPIEEALGYSQLSEQFQLTQEEIATKVGKSRAAVANALRLLRLPLDLQEHLRNGRISVGHAKALLGMAGAEAQRKLADKIVQGGLNVRQTESLAAEGSPGGEPKAAPPKNQETADPHVSSLEDRIRQRMGTKVHLRYNSGRGALEIVFFSDAELERILGILGVENG